MLQRKFSLGSLAVLLLAGVSAAAGQTARVGRIPITDPDRLAAFGFARDAKNVFLWSGADSGGGLSKEGEAAAAPAEFGTAAGYSTVMGYELNGFIWTDFDRAFCPLYAGGAGQEAVHAYAQLAIPNGASLSQLKFWAHDEDVSQWLTFEVNEVCQAVGYDPPTITVLASADTFGSPGSYYGAIQLNGYTVDTRNCAYRVRVVFAPADTQCASDKLQVKKLQVAWVRQVSPAPATASFTDVPTSHPFFQFIEALAESGVTGGCGGGGFCPDSPLTRGQMAVFMAKALGLSWP